MAENYEFDEWGGHKRIPLPNGGERVPMFGCAGGCPARFFTNDARMAHIQTMHPGVHSGPTEDMIQLARIRPELAESFGIRQEDLYKPSNMRELMEEDRIKKVLDRQSTSGGYSHHPVYGPIVAAKSHARMLEAKALGVVNERGAQEVRDMTHRIHAHLDQAGHGYATGISIDDPDEHLMKSHRLMGELSDMTDDSEYSPNDPRRHEYETPESEKVYKLHTAIEQASGRYDEDGFRKD